MLSLAGISHKVDETGTAIGRRYARTDELGIPFAITVDHTTLTPGAEGPTVTLRERDTCAQIRIPISKLVDVINRLSSHSVSWNEIQAQFPSVEVKEN
jgi:Glycyl-tRNA synthetase (class II)